MPHPVDEYVGKRLRLRRTILGLSQEAVGDAVGVTFQQIQKYERGINRIGCSRLFEFSRALQTPISFFFDGFETAAAPNVKVKAIAGVAEDETVDFQHEHLTSRETLELVRAYNRITDPQVRKRVYELVKSISATAEATAAA